MFSLTGTGSVVTCDIYPPLELSDGNYVLGLVDLTTYNSIPNIETGVNDKFYYGDQEIVIEEGSYEIEAIEHYIRGKIRVTDGTSAPFLLRANNNTLKTEIKSNVAIDFTKPNTIGPMLGFSSKILEPRRRHTSDSPVKIIRVDTIRVECNIVRGAYVDGKESHLIHEFYPTVEPGYKIVVQPQTIIYLPVNTERISTITVALRDQDGRLLNLRGESLSVRLHLKKLESYGISI